MTSLPADDVIVKVQVLSNWRSLVRDNGQTELVLPIEGWYTPKELAALRRVCVGLDVLEIGSMWGLTTAAMLMVARSVTAVDLFRFATSQEMMEPGILTSFHEFWRINGDKEQLTTIIGDSLTVLPRIRDESFDVVHIDGNHTSDYIQSDWDNAKRIVRRPGIIAVHDFAEDFLDILRVVDTPDMLVDSLAFYMVSVDDMLVW